MISNHYSINHSGISAEIQAASHIGAPAHRSLRRLPAGSGSTSLGQSNDEASAGHRTELAALIDHSHDIIGEGAAAHTVHNNSSHRQLPLIALRARFTVYDSSKHIQFTGLHIGHRAIIGIPGTSGG